MAKKPPPRRRKLDPLKKQNRKAALALEGLRPLTRAEATKLGVPQRSYTTQKEGVKKLRKEAVVGRRQAEKRIGIEPERLAKERRYQRGDRGPQDRYTRYLDAFRKPRGLTRGQARVDATFRKLYAQATNNYGSGKDPRKKTGLEKKRSEERLAALYELGVFSEETFSELFEGYV